ncbi:winged helix DNA-binding domain-containing protein [Chitinophaga japonensis]|uniref:Winged helix DNA-binding protein n=1 Tax=Chitinophaga japonensis TaxID=104662 RepID=A0A562TCM7_CHIJA|nr:winged helix DNA-binding domain-containing protein [Chitinophaga japonensis]TWI91317.1 winged helix DNA-binding protein [Chitinophaga japonensis]
MTLTEIANIRLLSQRVTGPSCKNAREAVSWMGAMQAQDFAMCRWAAGARTSGATDRKITAALNKGDILRTHLLRPTWHLVAAADIHWLLALTAPRILAASKTRHRQLELTEALFQKSNKIIANMLAGGQHLPRETIMAELKKAKIAVDENRSSHLLFRAELDGILCSGAVKNGRQTYALLAERAPAPGAFNRDEALAMLAGRYFCSRGPATLQDFATWSYLSLTDARHGLEMARPGLTSATVDGDVYWFSRALALPDTYPPSVHLLPAFDEYIIGYRNRAAVLPAAQQRVITNNGIFRPVVVINGQVAGLWKRALKDDKVMVTVELFAPGSRAPKKAIARAADRLGAFLGGEAVVSYGQA